MSKDIFFKAEATTFRVANNKWTDPSKPFFIKSIEYKEDTGRVEIVGSDGHTRKFIPALADRKEAANIWRASRAAFRARVPVIVRAKGNNSTDFWYASIAFVLPVTSSEAAKLHDYGVENYIC